MTDALRRVCADIVGLVFVVSSVYKLMDPVGTGLIVEEYFKFLHLPFLLPVSKVAGEILSLCEATVGIGLLAGVYRRFFAIATWTFMAFFTAVSLALYIFNPEMSCGCFGKAIELTHAQTLIKNLALDVLCCGAFIPLYSLGMPSEHRHVAFWVCIVLMLIFAAAGLFQTPFEEYSEFRQAHVVVGEGQPGAGSYEYPTLAIWDASGDDRSDEILYGKVAAISVYKPQRIGQRQRMRLASFAQDAMNAGFTPVLLSTSAELEIPGLETCLADYRKLITFNRSNGGVVFMDDGYIMQKKSIWALMSFDDMADIADMDPAEVYVHSSIMHSLALQGFMLFFLAMIFLL